MVARRVGLADHHEPTVGGVQHLDRRLVEPRQRVSGEHFLRRARHRAAAPEVNDPVEIRERKLSYKEARELEQLPGRPSQASTEGGRGAGRLAQRGREGHAEHQCSGDADERLMEVVERTALEKHEARIGVVEEVLVDGPSKTDAAVWSGRTRHSKLLHFVPEAGTAAGDIVTARVTTAAPHWMRGDMIERVSPGRRRRVRIPVAVV